LLLPEVTYFQVVFTLPDKLSSLILGNRRLLYRILMHAAWESLRESVEAELGMQASALLVLHTWNQRLEHHSHVHALVPGSGPSLDGQRWIEGKTTKGARSKPAKPFLVDNKALGHEFSQRFIRKLQALHRRGKLDLAGTCDGLQDALAWTAFTEALTEHDWCVFIEPPPTAESTPEHVLKYLARYMTGGPISDCRLVSCQNDIVTFLARNKQKGSSQKQVSVPLSGVEFTRRWSLHILPKGFTKTRRYGGYSSGKRTSFIALCKQLCPQPATMPKDAPSADSEQLEPETKVTTPCCPNCQQQMQLTVETKRPSWRDLFYGPDHHAWFES
jgi:hypothetical protein